MSASVHDNDPYKILGVTRCATDEEIKRAFRKLALQHHPDKCGKDSMFKRINYAYQILSDKAQREAYNATQSLQNDYSTILLRLFVIFCHIFSNKKQHETTQQKCLHIYVPVSVEEIYNKEIKKLSITVKRLTRENAVHLQSINLFLSLLNYQEEYVYNGMGDEYIDGDQHKFGDVIIHLNVKEDDIKIDKVLSKYDLYIEKPMSLYSCLYGFKDKIDVFGEDIIIHHNTSCPCLNVSKVIKGKGLPYVPQNETEACRGDLYVYYTLSLEGYPLKKKEVEVFLKEYFNERIT